MKNLKTMFTVRSPTDGNDYKIVRSVECSALFGVYVRDADRRRIIIVVSFQPPSAGVTATPMTCGTPRPIHANDIAIRPADRRPISLTAACEEVTFVGATLGAANGIVDGRVTHTARRQ